MPSISARMAVMKLVFSDSFFPTLGVRAGRERNPFRLDGIQLGKVVGPPSHPCPAAYARPHSRRKWTSARADSGGPARAGSAEFDRGRIAHPRSPCIARHSGARAQAALRSGPIVIDGKLDDAAWKDAIPVTDFTQVDPDEGRPAT